MGLIPHLVMEDNRLQQIEKTLEEIKDSQEKITSALLGSYDKNSVGLIEETRNLRREVDEMKGQTKIQSAQLDEVIEFKQDAKKIVAGIAMAVPVLFELIKLGVAATWEVLKSSN